MINSLVLFNVASALRCILLGLYYSSIVLSWRYSLIKVSLRFPKRERERNQKPKQKGKLEYMKLQSSIESKSQKVKMEQKDIEPNYLEIYHKPRDINFGPMKIQVINLIYQGGRMLQTSNLRQQSTLLQQNLGEAFLKVTLHKSMNNLIDGYENLRAQ